MRRSLIATALAALVLAAPVAAGVPRRGVLDPGRSLGGIRLGEAPRAVRATLGSFSGLCRGCASRTWYFTVRPFDEHGIAVEFVRGRVSAVYTLWQPAGWRAPNGVVLGASQDAVTGKLGALLVVSCPGYSAYVRDVSGTRTAYYFVNSRLWGFGLLRANASPCR